jgi:hypothetical protein
LLPVAGAPGSCQCAIAGQPRTQPQPLPPAIPEMPVPRPPQTTQMPPPSQPSAAQADQPEPNAELLAHARPAHPVTPPEKNEASSAPPAPIPVYTVLVPPLTFSASSPLPPPDPGADILLLVREAHLEPEWQFRGHVESPGLAPSITRALGLGNPAPSQPGTEPGKKKRGFWAVLRRIFEGHGAQD